MISLQRIISATSSSSSINDGDCRAIDRQDKNLVEKMIKNKLAVPVEDVTGRKLLSIDDITKAVGTGCVPKVN